MPPVEQQRELLMYLKRNSQLTIQHQLSILSTTHYTCRAFPQAAAESSPVNGETRPRGSSPSQAGEAEGSPAFLHARGCHAVSSGVQTSGNEALFSVLGRQATLMANRTLHVHVDRLIPAPEEDKTQVTVAYCSLVPDRPTGQARMHRCVSNSARVHTGLSNLKRISQHLQRVPVLCL